MGDGKATSPLTFALVLAGISCTCTCAALALFQTQRQKRHHDAIAVLSRTDSLTDVFNRRGFEERLEAELTGMSRTGRSFAVLLLDLDHFKLVNDTLGHSAGDELLRRTASAIKGAVRPMDSVGRLGGDEFAVLMPDTPHREAVKVAQRIRASLNHQTQISVGIACPPRDGNSRDELLRHADQELYALKQAPEGGVVGGPVEWSWAAGLADAMDERMDNGHRHSQAVAEYAVAIGQRLGWPEWELSKLRSAATLHDIGKLFLPDRIVQKPGLLSEAEYAELKKHPIAGAEIASRIKGLHSTASWIRHVHEHFDGRGYPDGLSDEAIPLASRIILVADAFDAMTHDRPYGRALSAEEALSELRRNAGHVFDSQCVGLLEEAIALAGR
jgi:diguanylate cyclase (GGDEF)-like protein